MIIDAHAHIFPHHGAASGYKDAQTHLMMQQAYVKRRWGRMLSNSMDEKYIPLPGEDIGFRVGKYGRYYWTKHGVECWQQRYPMMMVEMEWLPEQMLAFMDAHGVDKAVLQAGYMEINYCRQYFADAMKRFPGRFIGTITTDYDIEKSEKYREGELEKLRDAVQNMDMKGVFQGYPREQKADDERLEPFWAEMSRVGIPHLFHTGFNTKPEYLESLDCIERVLRKFPDLNIIITHLGGNIRSPDNPNYTDTPKELMKILKLPNVYFEVGYVLAYENWDVWKENYEYPYPLHTKVVKAVYDEVGAERLLWGSDMPNIYRTCTYNQCLDLARLHFDFLSEEEKSLVLYGNAAKLFRV